MMMSDNDSELIDAVADNHQRPGNLQETSWSETQLVNEIPAEIAATINRGVLPSSSSTTSWQLVDDKEKGVFHNDEEESHGSSWSWSCVGDTRMADTGSSCSSAADRFDVLSLGTTTTETNGLACQACTFLNEEISLLCECCGSLLRPASSLSPDEQLACQLQQQEDSAEDYMVSRSLLLSDSIVSFVKSIQRQQRNVFPPCDKDDEEESYHALVKQFLEYSDLARGFHGQLVLVYHFGHGSTFEIRRSGLATESVVSRNIEAAYESRFRCDFRNHRRVNPNSGNAAKYAAAFRAAVVAQGHNKKKAAVKCRATRKAMGAPISPRSNLGPPPRSSWETNHFPQKKTPPQSPAPPVIISPPHTPVQIPAAGFGGMRRFPQKNTAPPPDPVTHPTPLQMPAAGVGGGLPAEMPASPWKLKCIEEDEEGTTNGPLHGWIIATIDTPNGFVPNKRIVRVSSGTASVHTIPVDQEALPLVYFDPELRNHDVIRQLLNGLSQICRDSLSQVQDSGIGSY